ncbi:MAG: formylglycine-generating enzyme family protein [Bacteroidales bacterium]|nr:formylglycine-generating enzyme family protein [Bacteroidales bacterium]
MKYKILFAVFAFSALVAKAQYPVEDEVTKKDSVAAENIDTNIITITVKEVKFDMVKVKGGTFTMGCKKPKDKDCYENELPAHSVTVDDFAIGKYEVTQDLWVAVMDTNPSKWKHDSLPVEQVSWEKVQIFINKLNRITGRTFRLPTEAEWEYAARGGAKSKNYKYAGCNQDVGSYAWYGPNANSHTHKVGQKKPNELGLYDMSGNVMEWCSDYQGAYTKNPQTNPKGPRKGEERILRGGCWSSPTRGCRITDRSNYNPQKGYSYYGFRLVLVP